MFKWTNDNLSKCPSYKYNDKDDTNSIYNNQTNNNTNLKNVENLSCPFAHTDNEIIYHPKVYKMTLCSTYMKSRVDGGDISFKPCSKGDLCEDAHGENDLRLNRNNRDFFWNEKERQIFRNNSNNNKEFKGFNKLDKLNKLDKMDKNKELDNEKELDKLDNEKENIDLNKRNVDLSDLSNIDFDLSSIPEKEEGENKNLTLLREETIELAKQCKEHSTKYKRNLYRCVDTIMKRIEKETQEMKLVCKKEVMHLEKMVKKSLKETDRLENRMTCPICLIERREAVLDPCGHLFCVKCAQKNLSKECYFCRRKYKNFQVLDMKVK